MDGTHAATMEAHWGGGAAPFGASWQKTMMWIFIVTDALLFSGLLCGYAFLRQASTLPWPDRPQVFSIASPVPSPTPAPAGADPAPAPSPDCIHDSEHRVESVTLALYFVECSGRRIPLNEYNDVPLGCRIHLNATPRDGMHQPTCSRNWPEWQVDPSGLVGGPSDAETFTPVYQARDTGRLSIRCIVDNVRSNWVFFNLVPR